jgi:hypothetical protein
MPESRTSEEWWQKARQQAPSAALSAALHVLILAVLAVITWAVIDRPEPQWVFSLEPGAAGGGLVDGSGASHAAAPKARPSADQPAAPMPDSPSAESLEVTLDRLMPDVPDDAVNRQSDPSRLLLESLSDQAEINLDPKEGPGGGRGRGAGQGFGDYIAGLQQKGLDIVLVLDATNSMAPYIREAKERLHDILDVITGLVPNTRFGIVAYKDYGDDYGPDAVNALRLTDDADAIREFIDEIIATGGGDLPEPIHEALRVATNHKEIGWGSGRKRIIILVGDSPVHSSGRQAAHTLARNFARRGAGIINVIDVGSGAPGQGRRTHIQPDLQHIAQQGRGGAFLLGDREAFWRHLIVSAFDQRFKADIDTIIEKVAKDE